MTTDLTRIIYQALKGIIMKTKFAATALILVSSLLAGAPSFAESSLADDIYTFGALPTQQMPSGVTRAQVTAEFVRAHRTGEHMMPRTSRDDVQQISNLISVKPTPSAVTREQVSAELMRALRNGEKVAWMNGRDDDVVTSQLYSKATTMMTQ